MVFLGIYRALYDYAPQSAEELAVSESDLLFVLERPSSTSEDDGWWKCKKKAASDDDDEPEGLVPNNYVEEAKPVYRAKALYDYSKQTDEELSFEEGAQLEVYDATDPDWTLVGKGGEYGFAPAIYIEQAGANGASNGAASAPTAAIASPPPAQQRMLAAPPPSMARAPTVDDEPLPGEEDYVPPSQRQANPAAGLAAIIAQRTGGGSTPTAASPALPSRPQYTPEGSSDEEAAPPPMPQRPTSQSQPSRQLSPPRQQYREPSQPSPRYAPTPSYSEPPSSPNSGFHLYNVHETVSHLGRKKKLPTTLGINIGRGLISISPEKSKDGPSNEWTAEKLTHYSIEGKHVFVELVRPSKSVDFHAGAKDTAQEIVGALGELAGAARAGGGLDEVIDAASKGTQGGGRKKGVMLYEFMAQSGDEVSVEVGDEVIVVDDRKSEEWWVVRRLKNGREGVVPSSYVEVTGTVGESDISGLQSARSTVEQNRMEEERLAKDAARKTRQSTVPERGSSLAEPSSSNGDDRAAQGSLPRVMVLEVVERRNPTRRASGHGQIALAPSESRPSSSDYGKARSICIR